MKSHSKIHAEIRALVSRVERLSPRLFNLGLTYFLDTKLRCLEIMQKYALQKIEELFKTLGKEKDNSIHLQETGKLLSESIAFFEAYLNAFYSFLQILGRITPYFYDSRELRKAIPDDFFAKQISYFVNNPDVDPEYSNYLKNSMAWHDELMSNRHAITHNVSAFLGFGEEEIVFIDMPKRRIDFFENGKPTKKLQEYVVNNWNSLFGFLNFYVEHFSNRQIFVDAEGEFTEIKRRVLSAKRNP